MYYLDDSTSLEDSSSLGVLLGEGLFGERGLEGGALLFECFWDRWCHCCSRFGSLKSIIIENGQLSISDLSQIKITAPNVHEILKSYSLWKDIYKLSLWIFNNLIISFKWNWDSEIWNSLKFFTICDSRKVAWVINCQKKSSNLNHYNNPQIILHNDSSNDLSSFADRL